MLDNLTVMSADQNYLKYANYIRSWGFLAVFTGAFVFQALSTFGILGWLNKLYWIIGVAIVWPLISLTYLGLLAVAYEISYNNLYGPYTATAKQSARQITTEFSSFFALHSLFFLVFGFNRKVWLWG